MPLIFGGSFVVSTTLGLLISPLAVFGSVTAIILAVAARRDVARIYDCGQTVSQPIEPELLQDRAMATWALCLALPLLPFELLLALVLLVY